ncbi:MULTISPECIES: hypothetical protein [Idiomarina]|uniref:Transglutaminase-like domain-containing protein n=1 Tax=Idiomarina abyssalis TaxID=86102 RepID=A0A8I1G4J8_9GAMM|nr:MULTISPECIES: hypothetical protein [Idiomarina]KPD21491.1 hypothetical protein ADS78_07480 [Idiomarina abyssalis]MAL83739.1 hypothetical protein [Idiomarina sp.]MBH94146.1 hypothetical protein [Idiomarina sp.]MBJ7266686.1 hypothetical protein [Idiomarina abyssalis]MBJ7273047.1 hypothetical protein [Idiomarina abyssalis]
MTHKICAVIWLLFTLPLTANGQNFFNLNETQDGQLTFSYQWRDFNDSQQSFDFQVDKREFLQPLKRYRGFNLERSQRELTHQLNRYIRQQQWQGIQARLTPRQQSVELVTANSRTQEKQAQLTEYKRLLREYYNERWNDYLEANFYRQLTLPPGEQGIIPDHPAIASEMTAVLRPLIQAIGEQLGNNTQRNYINYIASFIQQIPYNDLSSKLDSRGDGFVPPNQLLYYNQGDCDSKVTLMSSVIKEIIETPKMAIIYLPNHAVFGISISSRSDDISVKHNGVNYILVDVTGPAAMPLGQVGGETEFQVNTEQYTVVPIN